MSHLHPHLPLVPLLLQDLADQLLRGLAALERVGPAGGLEGGVEHAFPEQPARLVVVGGVVVRPAGEQVVEHLPREVGQVLAAPLLLDAEVAAHVVELGSDVHALQLAALLGRVGVAARQVLRHVDQVLVGLARLQVPPLLEHPPPLLPVLLVRTPLYLDLLAVAELDALQEHLEVPPAAPLPPRPLPDGLVADVEPGALPHPHGHYFEVEGLLPVAADLGHGHLLDAPAVVVVLVGGEEGVEGVVGEGGDDFALALLEGVLGGVGGEEGGGEEEEEAQVAVHLQLERLRLLRPLLALALHGVNHYKLSNLPMNFLKSESYSLSPDEYLEKFKNPHQIISTKGDADSDEKDLAELNEILSKYYDDDQETSVTKERIISEVSEIVGQWMRDMAQTTKHPDFDFEELGYGLKVFGSYRLKTNSYDGDIDMLCIVPEFINRERHFFVILANYFRKHEHLREIFTIPDAIVPLIRLTLYGVQVDLLLSIISQDFMRKNPDFCEADALADANVPASPQELRSINGYRTALYLKRRYVEKYRNYRAALKAIKLWAKHKGIYSQIYGYLGGAAFSIMLAKICQLYPNYSALQLLDRFFFIYANWVWSIAVVIEKTKSLERPLESEMVILTPLEPHMNAGHYISRITSSITRKHLRAASKLVQEVNKGKRAWTDLFAPADFFAEYRNFIEISVMGERLEDFVPWRGNVESKIRKFIQNLEQQGELSHGVEVNPYPRAFPSRHPSFRHCCKYFIGIKCSPAATLSDHCEIDLTQSVRGFLELLENYPEIDKAPKDINIGFTHLPREAIAQDILDAFSRQFGPK